MQDKSLEQIIIKLQEQGVPSKVIADYITTMGQQITPAMSQRDGVTISQYQPDVPGVFISAEQQNVNTFNETMRLQEQMYANERATQGAAPAPRTQEEVVEALALTNPQYQVVGPQRTTVNSAGHIVHY